MAAFPRLLRNHLGRTWKLGVLASAGIFAVHVAVVRAYQALSAPGSANLASGLPRGLQQFMGIDKLPLTSLSDFLARAYQHPFVLAAVLAVPVSIAAALLAGEIEKRTISLLVTRGVGRMGIVISSALTCAAWSLLLVVASTAGTYAGASWFQVESPPPLGIMLAVTRNLLYLALAVSGVAMAFSAFSSKRSDALGWTVTILLLMYAWGYAAQAWEVARPYGRLSLFHYYAPAQILAGSAVVARDLHVLLGVGAVGLLAACLMFRMRDLNA